MVRCYGLCETYFEYGFSPQEGHFTVLLWGWKYLPPPYTHKHKLKEIKEQFSANNDLAISYEIVLQVKKISPIFDFKIFFFKKEFQI